MKYINPLIHDLDSVDESGGQAKDTTSSSGNAKVMGKPPVPAAGGAQQVTSPNPIVQRLPAFLDNHNYAKSPMQVRKEVESIGPVSEGALGFTQCIAIFQVLIQFCSRHRFI